MVIEAREARDQERRGNATLLDAAHAGVARGWDTATPARSTIPSCGPPTRPLGAVGLHLAGIGHTYLDRLDPDAVTIGRAP